MNWQTVIGVDIGGTKINMSRISNGIIVAKVSLPTRAGSPEQLIINDITNGIEQLMTNDVIGIGIGVPGLIDEKKGIIYNMQNIPSWQEVYLKKHLETHFGKKVCIANDANCFVQGEKIFGKGKKFRNFVGITLGTGVGVGIIINNNLYSGTLSVAGEFGSIPYLEYNYEHYCSGKFFKECHNVTGKEAYERALLGDSKAIKMFDEYGGHLGNFIKVILLALGPEAVILGGSVAKSYQFFHKSMMKTLESFPFKRIIDQLVIELAINENNAIIGAAALVYNKKEYSADNTLRYETN